MPAVKIHTEYIELHKLLKLSGVCGSGGEAKEAVTSGQVKVDGETEIRKGKKIRPGQKVEFQNTVLLVEAGPK